MGSFRKCSVGCSVSQLLSLNCDYLYSGLFIVSIVCDFAFDIGKTKVEYKMTVLGVSPRFKVMCKHIFSNNSLLLFA